jgi:cytochrome c peroxidase
MLWFDTLTGLNDDNACAGCHSPTAGFGDTQSIAIGIDSNQVVGPHRTGPRNMRRAPMVINTVFFPRLMWNSRFEALSGDPFDNRVGFQFPLPEGGSLSGQPHLLAAQAFIPPTERNETAGFHFAGDNDGIRAEVVNRLIATAAYRKLFARSFPAVKAGGPITYDMFAQAIAEFEFTLTFANAPIDRFARGELGAMTEMEKQGALLFFGAARCSVCHSVRGQSNEMFSDFQEHVIGIPQIAPSLTNAIFDGPGLNEDFGLEQVTGDPADRYEFRTSPLRNVAVQPTFMHNGAFTRLDEAIRHHLDIMASVSNYTPASQNLPADLSGSLGPMAPVLARLDPVLSTPVVLIETQFEQLLAFVRNGLLDPRATPERLRRLVPHSVPSGRPVMIFEFP